MKSFAIRSYFIPHAPLDSQVSLDKITININNAHQSAAATTTFAHNCAPGTNILVLSISLWYNAGVAGGMTGVTYNGQTMTLVPGSTQTNGQFCSEQWYIKNPANGSNNVVITQSTISDSIKSTSYSLYNSDPTSPIDASTGMTGNTTQFNNTLTLTQGGDFIIDAFAHASANNASGWTGQPVLHDVSNGVLGATQYRANIPKQGTFTMGWTQPDNADNGALSTVAIKAPTPPTGGSSTVSVSDSGTGADAASVVVTFTVTDSGSGVDAATVLAQILLSDVGSGLDSQNILASMTVADTGTGVDALTVLILVALADIGFGIEGETLLVNESMASSPLTGTIGGNASWNAGGYLQLTPNTNTQLGTFDYTGTPPNVFEIDFDLWVTSGSGGADAIWFYLGANSVPISEDDDKGGYGFAYDEYGGDSAPYQITFNTTRVANSTGAAGWVDGTWHTAKILVLDTMIAFYLDGNYQYSYRDISRSLPGTHYGWAARTGGASNEHRIRNVKIGLPSPTVVNLLTLISLSDSGSGADAISILAKIAVSDLGVATDALALLIIIALSDSGSGTDAVSAVVSVALNDSGTGTEVISILAAIALADSGSGADAASIFAAMSLSDSGAGADAIALLAKITLNDTCTGGDAIAILAQIAISETATGIEALTILVTLALSDSGAASDAISALILVSQSDSGVGADIISILAKISQSEVGSGTDALNIMAAIQQSDTGTGSDQLNIQASVPVADTGSGSDLAAVNVSIPVSDFGSGSEVVQISAQVNIADVASAVESLLILQQHFLSESGRGHDKISMNKSVRETYTFVSRLFNRLSGQLFTKSI